MLSIPDYDVQALIHETAHSQVYRARRAGDGLPVICKVLRATYPTPEELTRYKLEFTITRGLDLPGVIRAYELRRFQHTLAMIMEDFGGTSLADLAARERFPLVKALELGAAIAGTLGQVHAGGVIHKDINPSNIVYNPATGQLKLIDFGLATSLARETSYPRDPDALEGTLTYLSPEQTGRMNRTVDYRTDYYSLGVTLYQLLSGRLPFAASDPLELVHQHLAAQPEPLDAVDPSIPPMVSAVVLKLLAKNAEERYQSAQGVVADLERCRHELVAGGQVATFQLAGRDVSDRFSIPEKLYGRERELEGLTRAFDRVVARRARGRGAELVLVAGPAGIGKSALVHELFKPITRQRGFFIAGKFDQYQRNIPYFAVAQAFQALVRQLLTESDDRLCRWRERLAAALGADGQLVAQVVPALELIVGPQPPAPELAPVEAQHRFDQLFLRLTGVFARPEHPLVLFLDDLQWADNASLKLIELLATGAEQALLLIGAYRDNEVHAAHPLERTVEAIRQAGGPLSRLTLAPLRQPDLTRMVAETLHAPPAAARPLAELLQQKTGGNPFFARAFLQALAAEGLLAFERPRGRWGWSVEQIRARAVTDNVVELMAEQIQRLDPPTRRALSLGACIGNVFELDLLAALAGAPRAATARALRPAMARGLIMPLSKSHLSAELDVALPAGHPPVVYRFAHDRIQQAAYAMLPADERAGIHWCAGQHMLALTPAERLEQRIFDIANQLNQGRPADPPPQARELLTAINLRAARQARASAAFEPAHQYAEAALAALPEAGWGPQYELTLEIVTAAAELAFLTGRQERFEQLGAAVLRHARSALDTIRVHEVQAQALLGQGRPLEGIAHLLGVLELLGAGLPALPTDEDVGRAMADMEALLAGRPVAALLDLPPMSDPRTLAVMRLLASVLAAAHTASPNLFPLVVLAQVSLSIRHGNAPTSSFAYALYGLILSGVALRIDEGAQFCRLALSLMARQGRPPLRARTLLTVHGGAQFWTEPLRATLRPLQDCYQAAVEDGDPEFAGFAGLHLCDHAFFAGLPLPEVAALTETYHGDLLRLRQGRNAAALAMFRQALASLTAAGADPCALSGAHYDAPAQIPALEAANDRQVLFLLHLNRLILGVIFQEAAGALAAADGAATYLDGVAGQASVAVFRLYDSLARLAALPTAAPAQQARLLEQVAANQGLMALWASHAPANYRHKWHLVDAELHRLQGRPFEAMEAYDQAVSLAQEHGYQHEAALANELAARFYEGRGRLTIGRAYLREARYAYVRWGATAKVDELDRRHPTLRGARAEPAALRIDTTSGKSHLLADLDLATVLRASQAIAGEIVLDALLERLMTLLVEHVGAQTGYLLLERGGEWQVAATRSVEPAAPAGAHPLPLSIVNYVARTRETVAIGHAARDGAFTADPWVAERRSKAVLCTPLLHQGRLLGVVLLENNLAADLFTPARTEILRLLAAQAAISISHARLLREQTELNRALQAEVDAHERARRDRDRLAAVLEASPDFVGMSDTSGAVLWNNAALRRLRGLGPDADLSGRTIGHHHTPPSWELVEREGIPAAVRDGTWVGETAMVGADGREIPVSQLIIAHKGADGAVEYFSTIMRDISASKAAEAKIRQLNAELEARVAQRTAQLEAANRELEAFSYSVSHDLRAPLRAIDGFSRLLQEDYGAGLDPEARRYLGLVRQNVQRMGRLIDDLLAFSRMSRQELQRQAVYPDQLVRTALEDLAPDLAGRQVEWAIGPLPPCLGDPSLLQQVWVNLLSNAVKYTGRRPVARIEVAFEQRDGEGVYVVRDNGAGFDMRYADRLFGVFQRLHRPHEFEGTGIGLATVQRIVQRHGGRIWAEAAVDQGAAFFFTLGEGTGL